MNKNMHAAKKAKNDEFYTQLTDIEKELKHYKRHFKGKVVFCNCDDPLESKFWRYFESKFEFLGLKKLISTHYETDVTKQSYKLEITHDVNGDGTVNEGDTIKTPLAFYGDFRSPECVEILKEADIVVTNPPFSLFREFITLLVEHKKKFIVVGNMNAITYKETFTHMKANKLWLGNTHPKEFIKPNGSVQKFGNIMWFTNLNIKKRHDDIDLLSKYKGNESDYPKYDNYNAINVDKVADIPMDYKGAMGVPITFMDKYNPEQFEIIKFRKGTDNKDLQINGKCPYFRIIIKRK